MKEILKIIKSTKSWIRQGCVNTPNLNYFVARAATQELEKLAPSYGFNFLITFFQKKGDKSVWIFPEGHTKRIAHKIAKNPMVAYRLYEIWKEKAGEYYDFVRTFEEQRVKDLEKDYQEFRRLYIDEYAAVMITDYITIILSDEVFQALLFKYGKENKELVQRILLPCKKTFMNEEELSALKIGLLLKKQFNATKSAKISLLEIKQNYFSLYTKIRKHQKNFFWIQNNYKYTEPVLQGKFLETIKESVVNLNPQQIEERIDCLENYEKRLSQDRKEIYTKLKVTKKDQEKAELISLNGYWHDSRKKANLIGSYIANEFLKHFAERFGYTFKELQFTLPSELDLLFKGERLRHALLERRMRCATYIIGAKLPERILEGSKAKKIVQMTEPLKKEVLKDLRGTPVSYGIAQGKVRIIHNPKKESIREGEILVTSMTRPEFAPLMKKAAAIITDEGGITSHAAIISRELSKPCVVGTRIATKVLKDGDKVEVNANHGLIKILKR